MLEYNKNLPTRNRILIYSVAYTGRGRPDAGRANKSVVEIVINNKYDYNIGIYTRPKHTHTHTRVQSVYNILCRYTR